ncbi:unnamed protein product [Diatraea saccharalis]|uniref:Uncharacterized protein n=1 Tax=Diatraea saccharalis TaxID=40085 RepID=A0A9N9QYI5_9NEOP|nr:unnamed protein product [Diatraea saccharalis]
MNLANKCRTCLGNDEDMRDIHSCVAIAGENICLSDILENFYDYKVPPDDFYPRNICINCVHQLTITYSFKVLIETSARKLSENVKNLDTNVNSYCESFYESDHRDEPQMKSYKTKKRKCREPIGKSQANVTENELQTIFCVECKADFPSVRALGEHCINNHPIKCTIGRDCEYCDEKFEDFRTLVLHRKLHMRPYLCENCWEGFYNLNDLNSHSCEPNINRKDKNKTERVLRQCDQCGKSYPPGYIRIHMLTHSNKHPYSCKFCPKKFKVPGGLHSHILWNHKRTRNHKCEVCNATFISSSSRSSHIRKNHLKEKKYGCDNCGKRFFSKSELQRHSLTHTGVKNFHCHLCDKSYQTRYGLNVHLKSHSQTQINVTNL